MSNCRRNYRPIADHEYCASDLAVMTWREIGDELGVCPERARQIFINGIRKLRKRPELMYRLRELVVMRQKLVAQRQP